MRNDKFNGLFLGLRKVKFGIDKVLSVFLISIMGIMTLLVTYQVVVRYIFDNPSAFSEVASRYLFIWLVLFGGAYVFGLREHMAITFIKDKFNKKLRIIVEMVIELIVVVFAYTVMVSGGYSSSVRQMWQMDSALQIPMGVIYAAIPISGTIMLFYFLCHEVTFINELIDLNNEQSEERGNI
ncbi:TRAP transporter small permease [Vibrio sp. DW001]|uniref:TRAP transporter small permease n=1 Tax=Vibrio sp. DW001 TaxID=2912315 RepID=UPI0023AEB14E|nr:TRAP transporter small permease [Vibrio sp. DW001]WED26304.1 TRAP transporter small permease [Vibrio sp. DW001]